MRNTLVCIFAVAEIVHGSALVRFGQAWIWGPNMPSSGYHEDLAEAYPEHGFIQLSTDTETLWVDLVKRPPAQFFDPAARFCSELLPAAISEFFLANEFEINSVRSINIQVSAYPYVAACRCYMRTLIAMGFNRVGLGEGAVVPNDQVAHFCDYPQEMIVGRPAVERKVKLPEVSEAQMIALSSAPFKTSSFV